MNDTPISPHPTDFEQPLRELEARIQELEQRQAAAGASADLAAEIVHLKERLESTTREIFEHLTPWQRILLARRRDRPQTSDYVSLITTGFVELHGDRAFADDPAILTGFCEIQGRKVLLVGHQKGKNARESAVCHWGCAYPEGYRKAIQKMKLAERFHLPIVSLIDTPGAHPGIGAEERGQAQAIAYNLQEMSGLRVPIVCCVIGEGGSGGAIGIGLGDRLLIMENAYFSVISPEGCAAILWKTADKRDVAAKALRITAADLLELGVVDEVVPEPLGGAHRDARVAADLVQKAILRNLEEIDDLPIDELLERRYQKHRRIGRFLPAEPSAAGG